MPIRHATHPVSSYFTISRLCVCVCVCVITNHQLTRPRSAFRLVVLQEKAVSVSPWYMSRSWSYSILHCRISTSCGTPCRTVRQHMDAAGQGAECDNRRTRSQTYAGHGGVRPRHLRDRCGHLHGCASRLKKVFALALPTTRAANNNNTCIAPATRPKTNRPPFWRLPEACLRRHPRQALRTRLAMRCCTAMRWAHKSRWHALLATQQCRGAGPSCPLPGPPTHPHPPAPIPLPAPRG